MRIFFQRNLASLAVLMWAVICVTPAKASSYRSGYQSGYRSEHPSRNQAGNPSGNQVWNQGCLVVGSQDAAVTIEEFTDFQCPFCAQGAQVMQEILKNYSGRVKLVIRNLPLPFHTHASAAAKAFSAVCMQSSALADIFQKELFDKQDQLRKEGEPFLFRTAEALGVNVAKMKADMSSQEVEKVLSEDKQLANSLGFRATPSFMIGSESVVGALPYDELKKVIDRQLGQ